MASFEVKGSKLLRELWLRFFLEICFSPLNICQVFGLVIFGGLWDFNAMWYGWIMDWPLGSGLRLGVLTVRGFLLGVREIWVRSELGCVRFEIGVCWSLFIGWGEYFSGDKSYRFFCCCEMNLNKI